MVTLVCLDILKYALDDGYSGANLNRPGLDRLRDHVKAGILDRVLLTSPDRLARNYGQRRREARLGTAPERSAYVAYKRDFEWAFPGAGTSKKTSARTC